MFMNTYTCTSLYCLADYFGYFMNQASEGSTHKSVNLSLKMSSLLELCVVSTDDRLNHANFRNMYTSDFVDCLAVMVSACCKHSNLPHSFSTYVKIYHLVIMVID